MTSPPSIAQQIVACSLHDSENPEIEISQVEHRLRLINFWSIEPGARILEIGCGQGNCTAVLAYAVGPSGHVDAIDPAPADYGAPFTLGQAQAHISSSEVGARVAWHQADPVEFLKAGAETWDMVVLAHCIWYFQSPGVLESILSALRGRVQKVCIAEYALKATKKAAMPHVLAALARGALEAHKSQSTENIRTLLSVEDIKRIAEKTGWRVIRETFVIPESRLGDGNWEFGSVSSDNFLREIESSVASDAVRTVLRSARLAAMSAVEQVGGSGYVHTMDVWVAELGE